MPRKRSKAVEEPILETKQEVTETVEEVSESVIEKVEAEVITTGTVIANMLNVRSGPSKDFAPIGTLYKGDKIEYVTENDEWLKLTSRAGYVMKKFIQ